MPLAAAIPLTGGLAMLALVLHATAQAIRTGSLPRSGAIGVRTRATQHCDDCWTLAHAAAEPALRHAGTAAGAAAGVVVPLALLAPEAAVLAAAGLGYALVVALAVRSAVLANRATRRHHPS